MSSGRINNWFFPLYLFLDSYCLSYMSREFLKYIRSKGIFLLYLFYGDALSIIFWNEFLVLQGWKFVVLGDISTCLLFLLLSDFAENQLICWVFCTISSRSLFYISIGIGSSIFNFLIYLDKLSWAESYLIFKSFSGDCLYRVISCILVNIARTYYADFWFFMLSISFIYQLIFFKSGSLSSNRHLLLSQSFMSP